MPFAGYISTDNLLKLLKRAIKNGEARDKNRYIEFKGGGEFIETHYKASFLISDGFFRFKYYDTWVFAYDFKKRCVTDYGKRDYSTCTLSTVDRLTEVLYVLCAWSHNVRFACTAWTTEKHDPSRYAGEPRLASNFEDFRAKMSWVQQDARGIWWFYPDAYDDKQADMFWNATHWLRQDQNWRYFTFDWDKDVWAKRFIDADARRRWNARESTRIKKDKEMGVVRGIIP